METERQHATKRERKGGTFFWKRRTVTSLSGLSLSPSFETTLPPGTAHLALRTAAWKKKQRSKVIEQGEDITQKRQRRGT
jgi:hypothetical protein